MHVEISPRRLLATPGKPQPVVITISNTRDVIAGYALRVLGADPSWVRLEETEVSLFPEETGVFTAEVTVPHGMAAGERRIAIQVRELTDDEATSVDDVVIEVSDERNVVVQMDPLAQTAGKRARYGLLIDNNGNTTVRSRLTGTDAEGKVEFRFDPSEVMLAPGEHAVVDLTAKAKRPFLGSPVVRVLEVGMEDPLPEGAPTPAPPSATTDQRLRVTKPVKNPGAPIRPPEGPPVANATFVQRAVITRGPLSLLGLLAALSVFALVITLALSKIVGQSAADRNLALEIAAARNAAETSGTSGAEGTVRLLTSGDPVPGVGVDLYPAEDTTTPVATTSTDEQGAWAIPNLAAGEYKITFRGAGFVQLWYPQALSADDAEIVKVDPNSTTSGLDVSLGGVPASISGKIVGEDVSAATLALMTPAAPGGIASGDDIQGATVTTVPIGSDGTFELTDVPSPTTYELVVTKTGYATSTQQVVVGAGEEREGVEITLRKGDGLITGKVSSSSGPLGGVTLTATSGQTTVTTLSLTEGQAGKFTLRSLPTPATFTVVAKKGGYTSQTVTLTLAKGQKLKGVGLTLGRASASLEGRVSVRHKETTAPEGGVTVTVTDGQHTVVTATESSEDVGKWKAGGLAIPGTYTLTFSRPDLAAQTVSVSLDATGTIAAGSEGSTAVTTDGIQVTMERATATVTGVVRQPAQKDGPARTVGEVTVQLISGTATYSVVTATLPQAKRGSFVIDNVPPGTYTVSVGRQGVSPTSEIIELTAGQDFRYTPLLAAPASIRGVVRLNGGPVGAGWFVDLYRASSYPDDVYRTVQTDRDGRYRFDDVDAPEFYVVQAKATRGGDPRGSSTVQVLPSQQVPAPIVVDP